MMLSQRRMGMKRDLFILLLLFCFVAPAEFASADASDRYTLDQQWARHREAQDRQDQKFKRLEREIEKFIRNTDQKAGNQRNR